MTTTTEELPVVPAGGYDGQGARLDGDTFRALAAEYLFGEHEVRAGQRVHARYQATRLQQVIAGELVADGGELVCDGHRWVPVENAEPYAGLDELSAAWHGGELLQVSSLFCDHPVWTPAENVAFRVWHDTGHVVEGLGFDVDGELELFARQARRLVAAGEVVAAHGLFCESVYQLAACVVLGTFPDSQYVRTLGPVAERVFAELVAVQS